jgi:hypothetical protein
MTWIRNTEKYSTRRYGSKEDTDILAEYRSGSESRVLMAKIEKNLQLKKYFKGTQA